MKLKQLIIEERELELLKNIISTTHNDHDRTYNLSVRRLKKELQTAQIVSLDLIPEDIVRINSTVTIQMPENIKRTFKIVLPEKSNLAQNKLSILSPMGLALLGYAANDEILWQFPSGEKSIKILEVSQSQHAQNNTK